MKKGHGNHRLLTEAEFIGEDRITGWTMKHLGGFPGIIPGEGNISIEVYKVNEIELARLDRLEGYPRFYDRQQVNTMHGEAWIYHLANPDRYETNEIIRDGVWRRCG